MNAWRMLGIALAAAALANALPIVSFVDEPGFLIGLDAEKAGTIRYGMEALFAVQQTRVPWLAPERARVGDARHRARGGRAGNATGCSFPCRCCSLATAQIVPTPTDD